jgi:hypothetical protein
LRLLAIERLSNEMSDHRAELRGHSHL